MNAAEMLDALRRADDNDQLLVQLEPGRDGRITVAFGRQLGCSMQRARFRTVGEFRRYLRQLVTDLQDRPLVFTIQGNRIETTVRSQHVVVGRGQVRIHAYDAAR